MHPQRMPRTSLDRWEMRSGRNDDDAVMHGLVSLDRWEMRSGRNRFSQDMNEIRSLDRWEMRSGRNSLFARRLCG